MSQFKNEKIEKKLLTPSESELYKNGCYNTAKLILRYIESGRASSFIHLVQLLRQVIRDMEQHKTSTWIEPAEPGSMPWKK